MLNPIFPGSCTVVFKEVACVTKQTTVYSLILLVGVVNLGYYFIGASMREPHTREF